jgi:hypothetical protein
VENDRGPQSAASGILKIITVGTILLLVMIAIQLR